ncbi:hypothetical protein ABZ915_39355 [Streptomyces sp. NPDC046915]|uniref:hypothetical protein n=1 Tax=Streptomyces sp. NPDC046915 TaxID=3155257 RepID=UPI003408237F
MERTNEPEAVALRPAEAEPGVLVHSSGERRLAAEHWLLAAHPAPEQAPLEWQEHKVALLPLGTLFSAVRIPGTLIAALAGSEEPEEVEAFLSDAAPTSVYPVWWTSILARALRTGPYPCPPLPPCARRSKPHGSSQQHNTHSSTKRSDPRPAPERHSPCRNQ